MHNALAEHENVEVELVMGERLGALEHADDAVCLFDTVESAKHCMDRVRSREIR